MMETAVDGAHGKKEVRCNRFAAAVLSIGAKPNQH